jgi:1-deoxy-D-xylulose-5-phosphate reductoisomerase
MKKKIAILGSTGSIGRTLVKIIENSKNKFDIILLTGNKNYKTLLLQAKTLRPKNIIITDKISYLKFIQFNRNKKINIYNNFKSFNKIFKSKIDYTMSSITGLDGLVPTLNIIKFTKEIAVANKEALICGWSLLKKELFKFNTKFLPVDSEHFSIWYGLKNNNNKINKVIITASGGPFYNLPIKDFKKIKVKQALKHPNWKMGKKISIDSATMMNKVFEIIEAKNIFELNYKDLRILIHPKSYVHAIIQFKNGMSKIIVHDTNMIIPIFNTLYSKSNKKIKSKDLRIDILNNLSLKKVNLKRFPLVNILKYLPNNHSLYETLVVSINDTLVNLFLDGKINFTDISKKFIELIKLKEFNKYKKIRPNRIRDIINLNQLVRLKILTKHV